MRPFSDMDIPERPLEPPEPEAAPCCPCCGEECETLYRDRAWRIVGCENCMETLDAWETCDCRADVEKEDEQW